MLFILSFVFAGITSMVHTSNSEINLVTVRNLYVQSVHSKEDNQRMINFLLKQKQTPVIRGYLGGAHFIMASHVFMPWNKMSEFKTGKKLLEQAIKESPHDPELRFIRVSIQSNIPGFLNYSDQIKQDSQFLYTALPHIKDEDLKKRITDWLKLP